MKKILTSILLVCSTTCIFAENSISKNSQEYKNTQSITWLRSPKPQYTNSELKGQDRDLVLKIFVSNTGRVEKTEVTKSSGIAALDSKIERAAKSARFKPYKENGVAYPFIAEQPFELKLNKNMPIPSSSSYSIPYECKYYFRSQIWRSQENNVKTPFQYILKPSLVLLKHELENQDRAIDIEFKLSRKNEISDVKIIKSSGLAALDIKVQKAIHQAEVVSPRKFYQLFKIKFTDHVYFYLNNCE